MGIEPTAAVYSCTPVNFWSQLSITLNDSTSPADIAYATCLFVLKPEAKHCHGV